MTSSLPSELVAPNWTQGELDGALSVMRAAHLREGPPDAALRRNRIDRLLALLTDNAGTFTDALQADFGNRPREVSTLTDIAGILPDLMVTRARLASWMKPDRPSVLAGLAGIPTRVEKTPLGVVGVIGPWNFPIGLTVQPAASALAAGNRVMIKFSEVTETTAATFAELAPTYFSPEELVVVTGDARVGAAFSSLPLDHIFFTGSPGVGARVAAAAGANLVPVTLELGGKNPAVVARNANLSKAAERIAAARTANGGQLCLCPDYAFVPRDLYDGFVEAIVDEFRERFAATPEHLVSIVNRANFERVDALIEDARSKGAGIHRADPRPSDPEIRRIPPTVVTGMNDTMAIADDEVFGPVLSALPYDDITEVVDYVAARPSPLAAYWFGAKGKDYRTFLDGTKSGGVTVNDFALHCSAPGAPFGGVGRSGYGSYHGKVGFDTFSHHRTITTSRLPLSLGSLLSPPFNPRVTKFVDRLVRRTSKKAARRRAQYEGDKRV